MVSGYWIWQMILKGNNPEIAKQLFLEEIAASERTFCAYFNFFLYISFVFFTKCYSIVFFLLFVCLYVY